MRAKGWETTPIPMEDNPFSRKPGCMILENGKWIEYKPTAKRERRKAVGNKVNQGSRDAPD